MYARADLLRRAADSLDALAAAATGDRWEAVENYPDAWVVRPRWNQPPTRAGVRNPPEPSGYVAAESSSGDMAESDVRWMAALGPQVAAPLSSWLRLSAETLDQLVFEWTRPDIPHALTDTAADEKVEDVWRNHLAFARAVLAVPGTGEQP